VRPAPSIEPRVRRMAGSRTARRAATSCASLPGHSALHPHASSATDLIVSLASLAAAVADLRTAQQHATQAAAARRAAEHLHQVAHNRSTNAPTRRREHARASDLARADSPGGLKLAAPAAETAPATPRRAARPAHQRARPPPRYASRGVDHLRSRAFVTFSGFC
jgi:hypothetical protein